MEEILKFDTISQFNTLNRNETLHPLVGVVDLSKAAPRQLRRMSYGFYVVFLKEVKCGDLKYGISNYDYEEGTLVFVAPGQVIGSQGEDYYQPQGLALVFHADFIHGTALGRHMNDYSFFSYTANEALHWSQSLVETMRFQRKTFSFYKHCSHHCEERSGQNLRLVHSVHNYGIRYFIQEFHSFLQPIDFQSIVV